MTCRFAMRGGKAKLAWVPKNVDELRSCVKAEVNAKAKDKTKTKTKTKTKAKAKTKRNAKAKKENSVATLG